MLIDWILLSRIHHSRLVRPGPYTYQAVHEFNEKSDFRSLLAGGHDTPYTTQCVTNLHTYLSDFAVDLRGSRVRMDG